MPNEKAKSKSEHDYVGVVMPKQAFKIQTPDPVPKFQNISEGVRIAIQLKIQ